MSEWSRDIVSDLELVNNKTMALNEFVRKHWERFKPVYINYHGYIEDEAELYLLVHKFFNKIIRSDVQPLFNSDNQIFNYFKTAVKNKHYDDTHKRELNIITFTEMNAIINEDNSDDNTIEEITASDELSFDELIIGEEFVDYIFSELSKVLSEPYIKLLILLYKGYTPKEARKELGISLSTVRDRIGTIRSVMKEHLGIYK